MASRLLQRPRVLTARIQQPRIRVPATTRRTLATLNDNSRYVQFPTGKSDLTKTSAITMSLSLEEATPAPKHAPLLLEQELELLLSLHRSTTLGYVPAIHHLAV